MESSGIINLLKPAGMTSHDCINFLRRLTGIKRIGHSGTLDPMATGVLVACIGKATRIIEYLEDDDKEYRGEMLLGLGSETEDIWGKEIVDNRIKVKYPENIKEIQAVSNKFKGEIYQEPPGYSAVRIDGKRLYEYAREGIDIKPKKRLINVHDFRLKDYNSETGRIMFDLHCSKGTYVRRICHDLGILLGTGAVMSFLLRTRSGYFKAENAVLLEDLMEDYTKYLLPMDLPLKDFGKIELDLTGAKDFCNGKMIREKAIDISRLPQKMEDNKYCVYSEDKFLGIASLIKERRLLKAEKVLC